MFIQPNSNAKVKHVSEQRYGNNFLLCFGAMYQVTLRTSMEKARFELCRMQHTCTFDTHTISSHVEKMQSIGQLMSSSSKPQPHYMISIVLYFHKWSCQYHGATIPYVDQRMSAFVNRKRGLRSANLARNQRRRIFACRLLRNSLGHFGPADGDAVA